MFTRSPRVHESKGWNNSPSFPTISDAFYCNILQYFQRTARFSAPLSRNLLHIGRPIRACRWREFVIIWGICESDGGRSEIVRLSDCKLQEFDDWVSRRILLSVSLDKVLLGQYLRFFMVKNQDKSPNGLQEGERRAQVDKQQERAQDQFLLLQLRASASDSQLRALQESIYRFISRRRVWSLNWTDRSRSQHCGSCSVNRRK